MLKKAIAFVLISTLIIGGVVAGYLYHVYQQVVASTVDISEPALIQIERGDTLRSFLREQKAMERIEADWPFRIFLKQHPEFAHIKVGTYRISPGEPWTDVFRRLVDGDVLTYKVTFIEGWTFREFRRALTEAEYLQQTIAELSDAEVIQLLGSDELEHPEGWFYPDTYLYPHGAKDIDVLQRAHSKMQQVLAQAWKERGDAIQVESPYEALILASIIEKETAVDEERQAISGVFTRRLKRGMRLQTDPTVIYGMGQRYDGNIRRRDLKEDTPYNTYVHSGLPPTPIANPGSASIHAALHPESGSTLYFVALGDGSGRHYFSKSLKEHNRAVRRYLNNRRNR
tara:strand:- start:737 stop:1762 length:1026 start_codon:yes stop_codon:yes gene_type:complete